MFLTHLDNFHPIPLPPERFGEFIPPLDGERVEYLAHSREYLARCDEALSRAVLHPHAAMDVHRLRSTMIDALVIALFGRFMRAPDGADRAGIALVAVGGYGRREMSLYSDVDLLFLHDGGDTEGIKPHVEKFLYALWDLKLDVGHAVRTPAECEALVVQDHTIFTNLLEARLLRGDDSLFAGMQNALINLLKNDSVRRKFVSAKIDELGERHAKFGGSVYLLEPNLKEGKGGLRDLHLMRWLARANSIEPSFTGLHKAGIIGEEESRAMGFSLRFLLQIRNRLHLLQKRKTDQIGFDNQEKLARGLGFTDGENGILAVEKFMQAYYTVASQVKLVTENVVHKMLTGKKGAVSGFLDRLKSRDLDDHFRVLDNQISVKNPQIFEEDPHQLMMLFRHVQKTGLEIHFATKEAAGRALYLVNDAFRSDPRTSGLFREMMTELKFLGRALFAMHEIHFFDAYIPEFRKLRNRVQHDAYHVYTVDTHSIFAIRELSRLYRGEYAGKFASYAQALRNVKRKDLLSMGLLFHDIGKGEGGNHSVVGAGIAGRVALRLGYSQEERETIEFLILSHLMMPHLSQRRDLEDRHLIHEFAKTVRSADRLNMLYVLTWGDIRAVSAEAWTDWKGSLLDRLYQKTEAVLNEGDLSEDYAQKRMEDVRRAILKRMEGRVDVKKLEAFLTLISPRYLVAHDDAEIEAHFRLIHDHAGENLVFVEKALPTEAVSELLIYTYNNPRVMALVTGVMLAGGINILAMEVFTLSHGFFFMKLRVQTESHGTLAEAEITDKIAANLKDVFTGKTRVDDLIARRRRPSYLAPKTPTQKRVPSKIDVDNDVSPYFTIIDIYTHDRLGLLYDIIRCLTGLGCYMEVSKISTKVDQVVDSFYVKDIFGHKITAKAKLDEIKKALMGVIDPPASEAPAPDAVPASPSL